MMLWCCQYRSADGSTQVADHLVMLAGQNDLTGTAQQLWPDALLPVMAGIIILLSVLLIVQRYRLNHKAQRHRAQQQQMAKDTALLQEMAESMDKASDYQQLYDLLLEFAGRITPCEKVELALVEDEPRQLNVVFSASTSRRLASYVVSLDRKEHPFVRVIQCNQCVAVQSTEAWREFFPGRSGYREGLQLSTLVLPFCTANKVIGCIALQSPRSQAFSLHHQQMARLLATIWAQQIPRLDNQQRIITLAGQQHLLSKAMLLGSWQLDGELGEVAFEADWLGGNGNHNCQSKPTFERLLHPQDLELFNRSLDALLDARIPLLRMNARLRHNRGHWLWVTLLATQKDNRVNGVMIDISESKRLKANLLESKQQADMTLRERSRALANMSHDLRTPMNTIIGVLNLINAENLATEQRQYLHNIKQSSLELQGIIDDILQFATLEAGSARMHQRAFSLDDTLNQVALTLATYGSNTALKVVLDADLSLPQTLVGDPVVLSQLLSHLCMYGLRHADNGYIALRAKYQRCQQQHQIDVQVRFPQGGWSGGQLRAMLKQAQDNSSMSGHQGRAGLGIYIAIRLAGLMATEITFEESKQGECVFQFTLLTAAGENDTLADVVRARDRLPMTRIVVADNCAPSSRSLVRALIGFGCQTVAVNNREELWHTLADNEFNVDVIIADEDYYSWYLSLPEHLQVSSSIGIIDPASAAARRPPTATLTRPFSNLQLFNCLCQCRGVPALESKPLQRSSLFHNHVAQLQGARLLLAEDNEMNRHLAETLLQQQGLEVITVNNGKQAVELLQHETFDGVLMDCQMPVMDGYEATRLLRQQERFRQLPIIAMTASAMQQDLQQILACGMNGRITKPIDIEIMFAEMAKWITPAVAATRIQQVQQSTADAQGMEQIDIAQLDVQEGLDIVQGNSILYRRLLSRFAAGFDTVEQEYKAQSDPLKQKRLMHSLKGAAANIGARHVSQLASQIEAQFQSGNSVSDGQTEALLTQLYEELTALITAIKQLPALPQSEPEADVSLTPAQLTAKIKVLKNMIDDYDSGALDKMQRLKEQVHTNPWQQHVDNILKALEVFDFELAAQHCESLLAEHSEGS